MEPPVERDYTCQEVAERLGISLQTVRQTAHKLFATLEPPYRPYRVGVQWRFPRVYIEALTSGKKAWPPRRFGDEN